jgi:restriction system protein
MPDRSHTRLHGFRRYAWLIALGATVGVYFAVRHDAPVLLDESYARPSGEPFSRLAWVFALPFALLTIVALGRLVADWRLFKRQVRKASLNDLSWRQFERLIGEMYRRQGYSMVETPRRADGGIDYMLARGPERWLVQCKHWQARKVGVKTVRELAGIVAARQAAGGIVITTGRFTPPAQALATTSDIRLVDGKVLAEELLAVSSKPGLEHLHPAHRQPVDDSGPPACPECGGDMIKRASRNEDNAVKSFWGCARHPDCEGMVTID